MGFFRKLFGLKKKPKQKTQIAMDIVTVESEKKYSAASYAVYGTEVDPIYLQSLDCGLLPGEIVLLDWLDNKTTDRAFPDYFALLYGLKPEKSTRKLILKKLIEYSSPLEALYSLKVDDLKNILEAHELPKTGRKAELITRIADSLSEADIAKYVNGDSYSLTEGGKALLEEYYYIPYAHKNRVEVTSVAEMLRYLDNRGEIIDGVDLGTEVLLKRVTSAIESKNYFLLRNCFLNMGKINSSYEDQQSTITAYLCMFICEVSGWGNHGDYHENNVFNDRSAIMAANALKKSKLKVEDSRAAFDHAWSSIENLFPKHYLGKEKSYECLVAGFNKDTEAIRRLLNLDNRKERDYSSYKF